MEEKERRRAAEGPLRQGQNGGILDPERKTASFTKEVEIFEDIFDKAPHLACITRREDGRFLRVNEAYCRVTGYRPEEVLGRTSIELNIYFNPKDRQAILEGLKRDGEVIGKEVVFRKKDGSLYHSLVSARPYRYQGEDCLLLMLEDISRFKALEASLRASEERYRLVVENASEGILVLQDGEAKLVNPRLVRLLGYEPREGRGRSFLEFIHPEDREKVLKRYRQRLEGKEGLPEVYEFRALAKDGSVKILQVRSVRIVWEGRPATLNLLADVTERRATEEKYRLIIENMEEGYYEVDLKGTYTFVNPAVCRYHQAASPQELIGLNYRDFMPPETAERVFKLFNQVFRTGVPARSLKEDVVIIRKDGQQVPLDLTVSLIRDPAGNPIGFRGITFDASERRQLEAEWERYRDFVENVDDGCFELDLQGNLTFANPAAVRRFGYPWEELRQMNNRDYTTPETAKRAFQVFNRIYRTGEPATLLDYEVIGKNGEKRYVDISASLIRDAKGRPVGFRGTSRDVMERKKIEAERERLLERLSQAQKLEALGTLAGGVAHDFNNLLMAIQGNASLMLLDLDATHPHYPYLESIEAQVKTGAEWTRQLLGYARVGRYEVLATDLNDLTARTISLFSRMKKEIRVYPYFAADLWQAEVDHGQMEQVLMSLFMNAAEAMPGGGSLFLQTENVVLDPEAVQAFDIPPGPYVKLSITDTGVGMDEKTRQRIFEPFFTTKEMGRGTGLGLAAVYGIIRGHKGMIEVSSQQGQGTSFFIYLPAIVEKKNETTEKVRPRPSGQGTVLLVDDEEVILQVVGGMLRHLGYEVLIARSGEEAVETYSKQGKEIDVVLMDMVMPGIGGGKAIEKIQEIRPGARIILTSGYSLVGEAQEIIDRGGAQSFLAKPFQLEDLSKILQGRS